MISNGILCNMKVLVTNTQPFIKLWKDMNKRNEMFIARKLLYDLEYAIA
jgi:hypothetical protein